MILEFRKPKRHVDRIFIHCSASDNPDYNLEAIRKDHVENRGWDDIGYHYFVDKNGRWKKGRDLERDPAAQYGHNKNTIAICFAGLEKSKFTYTQLASGHAGLLEIQSYYNQLLPIIPHNHVSNKDCPVFDVVEAFNLYVDPPEDPKEKPKYYLRGVVKPLKNSRTLKGAATASIGGVGACAKGGLLGVGLVGYAGEAGALQMIINSLMSIWQSIPSWLFVVLFVIGMLYVVFSRLDDHEKERLKNIL